MQRYLQILLFGVVTLSVGAFAQSPTLKVMTKSSEISKIKISTQTCITFSKDRKQMIVSENGSDSSQTFNVNDIEGMVITIDSSGILPETMFDNLKISYAEGILTISGNEVINYSLWNINGVRILMGSKSNVVTLDLSNLTNGVYVVKANSQSLKFIKS